ncbi:SDR family oxidoreductase [Novosphingobium sp. Leaf2]|uniref:SDR family oxidoreductase n=1 Tax=Novosphingobium sp. Leaf2 TaxID=1735670 RepID=UPI0006F5470C|nr:SDR family oxidoreductase [Novosphingobium sp. Leaf2]KQM20788.1 short-chain dehydrogenase [Novosphingobium sp. Leaf2]
MADLKGKVALVTGASRGIGREIATRLGADGATVAVHYGKNPQAAAVTVEAIEKQGGKAFAIQADLQTPETSLDAMFEDFDRCLKACTGQAGLDIIVNNAGQIMFGSVDVLRPADFDKAFAVDVKAPFFVTQRALPRMRDGGRIINISSATARVVNPDVVSYAMAKGALDVFSRTIAQQLGARGITVNSVAPGPTGTEEFLRMAEGNPAFVDMAKSQSALRRLGTPADIANIVAFLASDESGWITGQLIDATGGTFLG